MSAATATARGSRATARTTPPTSRSSTRTLLAMFQASLERDPDFEIVRYFDGMLTLRELDQLSDAFAVALTDARIRARRPARDLPAEHPAGADRGDRDVEGGRDRRLDQPDEPRSAS